MVHSTGSVKSSHSAVIELLVELLVRPELSATLLLPLAMADEDFLDAEAVRSLLEREVYASLPDDLEEGDVMIDFTGGGKTTTAGALLAGLLPGRLLEVVPPKTTDPNQRGTEPGDPQLVDINYHLRKARL
jgi:hypothetical protein